MEYLDQLNPQQHEAVTAGTGQILVIAGPGSGKTRVLTQRIVYLMRAMGVRPYNILAVTFTNKAAKEMQTRIEGTLGESVQGSMWIGTFHAVCARILRREAGALPFDSNFVIMDADDQQSLIKRIIKELNLDDKAFRPNALHNAISAAKNNLQFPEDMPRSNYREETLYAIRKSCSTATPSTLTTCCCGRINCFTTTRRFVRTTDAVSIMCLWTSFRTRTRCSISF